MRDVPNISSQRSREDGKTFVKKRYHEKLGWSPVIIDICEIRSGEKENSSIQKKVSRAKSEMITSFTSVKKKKISNR